MAKISQERKTTENSLHKPQQRNQNWQAIYKWIRYDDQVGFI